MQQYRELIKEIQDKGSNRGDRTGTGTRSIFGHQMRFDLSKGFPLVTGKKTYLRSIIYELLWFLKGETNIGYLKDNGVSIWDEWADENGELGPVYGAMWRHWPTAEWDSEIHQITEGSRDQIAILIEQIKNNPLSRRHIISGWNPNLLPDENLSPQENVAEGNQALPPCHTMFQFYCTPLTERERWSHYVRLDYEKHKSHKTALLPDSKILDELNIPKYKLSCQLYQRSADVFLGVPFNIASYSLLTMMIAKVTNCIPDEFIWTGGDCHLYLNHEDQIYEYLYQDTYDLPTITIEGSQTSIDDFEYEDFILKNYKCGPAIKAPISV